MKRYKLKKDLPTFKAGEVFELWDSIETQGLCRESDGVMAYHQKTLDKFPNILTDWFEEIKEPTRWKPELGHDYYYISGDGHIYDNSWDDSQFVDRGRFEIGNCFQTKEEAEKAVERLKAWERLKGAGLKFKGWNKSNHDRTFCINAEVEHDVVAFDFFKDLRVALDMEISDETHK